MLLRIAWAAFGLEALLALAFGYLLWWFWKRAAMPRSTAHRALVVYALGCAVILVVSLVLPL